METKPKPTTTASAAKPKLTILEQAEAYIRNKCRNHYRNLLRDCEKQDFLNAGCITKDQFVAVLARCQGTRLSKEELAAIHKKYQKTDTKRWIEEEKRGIDYIKLRDLFHDWFKNNDMEDPKIRSRAVDAQAEAQKYLKFQFRNNFRQIFNVFRALDTHNTGALNYEVFQRLLSLYGGVRMTKDEWWGFSKMVDKNGDGKISYDEFASMFKDFDNGEEAARLRQVDDKIEPDGVERLLALRLQGRLKKADTVLRINDTHSRGELTAEVFRRSVQQFGLRLSDPELEALMRKYKTHSGLIDYIRFIQCIGQTQK